MAVFLYHYVSLSRNSRDENMQRIRKICICAATDTIAISTLYCKSYEAGRHLASVDVDTKKGKSLQVTVRSLQKIHAVSCQLITVSCIRGYANEYRAQRLSPVFKTTPSAIRDMSSRWRVFSPTSTMTFLMSVSDALLI